MQKMLLSLLACVILSACATTQPKMSPICQKLRRQQSYNRFNNSVEASWNTKSQNKRLKQLIKENNC